MAFNIRMGLPEMEALWNNLSTRKRQGQLDKAEEKFFKKLVKSLGYLAENPRHNSLASHEIDDLTRKYGFKIFQSYLENNTPSAGRMFWAYGPDKRDITVLPSNRTRKIKNAVLISVSNCPPCHRQNLKDIKYMSPFHSGLNHWQRQWLSDRLHGKKAVDPSPSTYNPPVSRKPMRTKKLKSKSKPAN
jgi:hypothetical protein